MSTSACRCPAGPRRARRGRAACCPAARSCRACTASGRTGRSARRSPLARFSRSSVPRMPCSGENSRTSRTPAAEPPRIAQPVDVRHAMLVDPGLVGDEPDPPVRASSPMLSVISTLMPGRAPRRCAAMAVAAGDRGMMAAATPGHLRPDLPASAGAQHRHRRHDLPRLHAAHSMHRHAPGMIFFLPGTLVAGVLLSCAVPPAQQAPPNQAEPAAEREAAATPPRDVAALGDTLQSHPRPRRRRQRLSRRHRRDRHPRRPARHRGRRPPRLGALAEARRQHAVGPGVAHQGRGHDVGDDAARRAGEGRPRRAGAALPPRVDGAEQGARHGPPPASRTSPACPRSSSTSS